jgi:hypothetical protein
MARRARGAWATRQATELVSAVIRGWERGAEEALPPPVRAHLRAAAPEGLLAVAPLCEEILRGAETRTRRARQRVERIPVAAGAAGRWRSRQRRRR